MITDRKRASSGTREGDCFASTRLLLNPIKPKRHAIHEVFTPALDALYENKHKLRHGAPDMWRL
jgi:hypothetical protein